VNCRVHLDKIATDLQAQAEKEKRQRLVQMLNSQSQQYRQPAPQSYLMSRQTNNTSMVYDQAVSTNCYQGIREVPWLRSTGPFSCGLISAV
jgi:hypothetical protein